MLISKGLAIFIKPFIRSVAAACLAPAMALGAAATPSERIDAFVGRMVTEHGFERAELEAILDEAVVSKSILKLISRPAERTEPWYEYRRRVSAQRIAAGRRFLADHATALARAETRYGVPPEVVTAILGVETNYGTYPLKHRVLDALYTLSFHYPPRAATFEPQFEDFLLLAREESRAPASFMGSYAGAMGVPQFMPVSFRTWAVDFDEDGLRDIWQSMDDVIGSVAAYLAAHGWERGEPLVAPVRWLKPGSGLPTGVKPERPVADFLAAGIAFERAPPVPPTRRAALLDLAVAPGETGYWLVFQNFYAITRYNASAKYAMVVTQLADALAAPVAE